MNVKKQPVKNLKVVVSVFLKAFFVGFTTFFVLVSWYRIVTTTAPDFSVYYGAAKLLLEGKSLSGDTGLYTGFGYPPATLSLFLPFLLFPYELAQGIWVTISFFLIPVCVLLAFLVAESITEKKGNRLEQVVLWSCIWFWSFPTKWTIGMGQINIVSLFFLLAGIWALQKKSQIGSSLFFCLLLLSKPHFVLLFPFLYVHGYRKVSVLTLLWYGIITSVVVGIFGIEYYRSYIQNEVPPLLVFTGREIYFNQSLGGFFSRIFFVAIAKVLTQIATGILLIGVGVRAVKKNLSVIPFLSVFLPAFLLIEPLGWQHHFVFILPVFLWVSYFPLRHGERVLLVFSYLLISWNIQQPQLFTTALNNVFIVSHAFWGAILLLAIVGFYSYRRNT